VFRVDGRQTGSYALDGVNFRIARHPTTIRKLATSGSNPGLKRSSPATNPLSNSLTFPLPPQFCNRALPDPASSKACGADSDREFLWSRSHHRRRNFQMN
jgi:hypothetical protein